MVNEQVSNSLKNNWNYTVRRDFAYKSKGMITVKIQLVGSLVASGFYPYIYIHIGEGKISKLKREDWNLEGTYGSVMHFLGIKDDLLHLPIECGSKAEAEFLQNFENYLMPFVDKLFEPYYLQQNIEGLLANSCLVCTFTSKERLLERLKH